MRQPSGRLREWHVISTSYGHQLAAERDISAAGWRVYNPLHLQQARGKPDKIVPLFANYMFVAWDPGTDWSSLRHLPGVWSILMSEPGKPAVVPEDIMRNLRMRTSSRRIVDDPLVRRTVYPTGTRLVVRNGPLAGLEGICKRDKTDRVTLLFSLLGHEFQRDVLPVEVLPADL